MRMLEELCCAQISPTKISALINHVLDFLFRIEPGQQPPPDLGCATKQVLLASLVKLEHAPSGAQQSWRRYLRVVYSEDKQIQL